MENKFELKLDKTYTGTYVSGDEAEFSHVTYTLNSGVVATPIRAKVDGIVFKLAGQSDFYRCDTLIPMIPGDFAVVSVANLVGLNEETGVVNVGIHARYILVRKINFSRRQGLFRTWNLLYNCEFDRAFFQHVLPDERERFNRALWDLKP